MEPALREAFVGATFFPDSAAVTDPRHAMQAYLGVLRQSGGQVEEREVRRLLPASDGWRLGTASGEDGPFDDVVVAAGPWTNRILAPFGQLPLVVERGYLRRYALAGREVLRRPVYDVEGGYVLSPRPEGVQLSTGAEFTRIEATPRHDMFLDAERQARVAVALGPPIDPAPVVGNRPSLPDGLPAIGPVGPAGLWVAAGHQHVGFSTGPASGELLRDLILGRSPALDPRPFSPSRRPW
jgi:D-amino-acid dehydrogenase